MTLKINNIYQGDCRDLLIQLDDNSIDCIITSPPYWSLRDYDVEASVWDDDPECEHDFKIERIIKDNSHEKTALVTNILKDHAGKDYEHGFCSKCNAWKGQLGLEPTFDLYIKHLCDIFDIAKEKLKKEGTCWVNLGDSYNNQGIKCNNHKESVNNLQNKQPLKYYSKKCLCLTPERFAIEMCNPNWILREDLTKEERKYVINRLLKEGLL